MNLLYVGYWGYNEGITQATVIPHLKILSSIEGVERIHFTTIERTKFESTHSEIFKNTFHHPLSGSKKYFFKIFDFIKHVASLSKIIRTENIDFIISRGVMAGALGYLLFRRFGIQFCVESFEPHAEYMKESGVWKSWGLRYKIQKFWENKQLKLARYILPVTDSYRSLLLQRGFKGEHIFSMPCAVDLEKFRFDSHRRNELRHQLGVGDHTMVGIYVGKFGGIYYDVEAFRIFKQAFDFFGDNLFLIILSGDDSHILKWLKDCSIPKEKTFIKSVPHDQVEWYLSVSDFAFSTIKPAPSRKYCSPIKNGEYWANGLPIIITEGVGDDAAIVMNEDCGMTYNLSIPGSLNAAFKYIQDKLMKSSRHDRFKEISVVAEKHRSYKRVREVYNLILNH